MGHVSIIGMGMSPRDLTSQQLAVIEQADILVGGQRHLDGFEHLTARKKTITRDLDGLIDYIRRNQSDSKIVVLASGDPLFYGIGGRLLDALEPDTVTVYPNITSVAAAFARIKEPWHDAAIISLHGRTSEAALIEALKSKDKIAVLTDPRNSPACLADKCLKLGYADFRMCVLEKLGTGEETTGWHSLPEAAGKTFAEPNLVVLKAIRDADSPGKPVLQLGMPESAFDHRSGMITKAEIRAVTLSKLALRAGQVFWDLGAGSGSVAIEAALFVGSGQIFAVERQADRLEDIRKNADRFGLTRLTVVEADLPAGLAQLPAPDRVFIGGGGKRLADIIRTVAGVLKPDGIVVANTVLLQSLHAASKTLAELGFAVDVTQIQVNRSRAMPRGQRLEAENPVWIISAKLGSDF
jgi:precorrin-6Y C5,15-methyltransferase (decarboxylating)